MAWGGMEGREAFLESWSTSGERMVEGKGRGRGLRGATY